jgi:hypothetical protein
MDLAKLHGIGPKALRIIEDELERHGLALGDVASAGRGEALVNAAYSW